MEQITSRENPNIKRVCRILAERRERESENAFVAEGVRLCLDAFMSGINICEIYVTEKALQKCVELERLTAKAGRAYLITEPVAMKIADTKSTQGVFLVCERRVHTRPTAHMPEARYLLLASLQDPGNVGAIIRTAEAFGLDGIAMTADCPDLYSPKVMRSAMGGVFRLPIWTVDDMASEIAALRGGGAVIYAAALGVHAEQLGSVRFQGASAVLLGNEGAGLSGDMINACDAALTIPMAGRADSLGVAMAAGILAWEMKK